MFAYKYQNEVELNNIKINRSWYKVGLNANYWWSMMLQIKLMYQIQSNIKSLFYLAMHVIDNVYQLSYVEHGDRKRK